MPLVSYAVSKCDERKPTCSRCEQSRLSCAGYPLILPRINAAGSKCRLLKSRGVPGAFCHSYMPQGRFPRCAPKEVPCRDKQRCKIHFLISTRINRSQMITALGHFPVATLWCEPAMRAIDACRLRRLHIAIYMRRVCASNSNQHKHQEWNGEAGRE